MPILSPPCFRPLHVCVCVCGWVGRRSRQKWRERGGKEKDGISPSLRDTQNDAERDRGGREGEARLTCKTGTASSSRRRRRAIVLFVCCPMESERGPFFPCPQPPTTTYGNIRSPAREKEREADRQAAGIGFQGRGRWWRRGAREAHLPTFLSHCSLLRMDIRERTNVAVGRRKRQGDRAGPGATFLFVLAFLSCLQCERESACVPKQGAA